MNAYVINKYGSIDNLNEVDYKLRPLKDNYIRVKMEATSLNAADLDYVFGHPLVRFTGFRKPGYPILGSDCVGVVSDIGSNVTKFSKGDLVWADLSNPLHYGTFAEYVDVPVDSLAMRDDRISYLEAACMPTASMIALQNVFMRSGPSDDHTALVVGAGGGIGTALVQFLVSRNVKVYAVDKAIKHERLKKLGVSKCYDYKEIDYTKLPNKFDFIYELACNKKIRTVLKRVNDKGTFVILGGTLINILKVLCFGFLFSLFSGKRVMLGKWKANNLLDLEMLTKLYNERLFIPVVTEILPFSKLKEGLKKLNSGNVIGKVVIDFKK